MGKHNNDRFNESDSFETDKFEMIDTDNMYMDRASAKDRRSSRESRREKIRDKQKKRDRYIDEMYGY